VFFLPVDVLVYVYTERFGRNFGLGIFNWTTELLVDLTMPKIAFHTFFCDISYLLS